MNDCNDWRDWNRNENNEMERRWEGREKAVDIDIYVEYLEYISKNSMSIRYRSKQQ